MGQHNGTPSVLLQEGPSGAIGIMPFVVSSMLDTNGRLPSMAEKGAITSPSYGLMRPVRNGTEPGTLASEIKLKRPIMARRPLLISMLSLRALSSSLSPLVKPNGSNRLNGTGCGISLKLGKYPGLPPRM